MTTTFVRDAQWFRSRSGKGVLAGSPLTYFGVTDAGALVLDAIESNHVLPVNHEVLTDRLLATGAVHPIPSHTANPNEITVVIPAFITNELAHTHLVELVTALSGLNIIVVDDASPHEITLTGVRIIRLTTNSGPAVARNTGIAAVSTRLVACIDSDVIATTEQIVTLGAYLDDPRVGLVAPRITCTNDRTFIGEYESHHSPLDLGAITAIVRPMSRVSYVPATVIVCDVQTLRSVGIFDETMRLGEDVDLVWRLIETGVLCRYIPSVQCPHSARPSIRAMLKQRFDYGTSAAPLDHRHPRSASPLRAHLLLLLVATSILMGYIYVMFVLLVPTIAYFVVSLRSTSVPLRTRLALVKKAIASTTQLLADAVMRAWWPIFFLLSFVFLRAGVMLTFSAFVPPIVGLIGKKSEYPIRYVVVRILEDMAYGLGVWVGAIRARSLRCLLPVITVQRSVSR